VTGSTISGTEQERAAIEVSATGGDPHPLAEAGRQATETVGHLAERAADVGLQQADRGRQLAAQGIGHLAHSIRQVSTDLEAEQPAMAGVALTAAEQAERAAQFLHETDARQIIAKVEEAARRQPLVFLGGALLLGAIGARFLKAASHGALPTGNQLAADYADSYATNRAGDSVTGGI
jgi:hypothetical protein